MECTKLVQFVPVAAGKALVKVAQISYWAYLEVSSDGNGWTRIYGITGVRSDWAEQSIDLSPWKNQTNLRLRFLLTTDSGGTEDGWYIDGLSLTDHSPARLALPVQENFEAGQTNWLQANWNLSTNQAFEGAFSARSTYGPRMTLDTPAWLELDHEIVLTNCLNPQLTPNWQTIAGPLTGTNWSFQPSPGNTSGFYRVRQ